jgi:hypothetical protein
MPVRYDDMRTKVYETIAATVVDITTLWDSTEAQLQNWRDLVELHQEGASLPDALPPPWAAVDFGPQQPTNGEYGVATDYLQVVCEVFLIYDWDDGNGSPKTVDAQFEQAYGDAQLLVDGLWNAKGDEFGMVERPFIDGSVGNQPNSYFLDTRTPLFGVVVTSNLLIGGLLVAGAHEAK